MIQHLQGEAGIAVSRQIHEKRRQMKVWIVLIAIAAWGTIYCLATIHQMSDINGFTVVCAMFPGLYALVVICIKLINMK